MYLFLAVSVALGIVSCSKDADYDKLTEDKGIDLTVSIANGGLTIPFGSTDTIFATELIDPEDSENISIEEDGTYYLGTDGSIDNTSITVNDAQMDVPVVKFEESSFVFEISNLTNAEQTAIQSLSAGQTLASLGTLTDPAISTPSNAEAFPDTTIIVTASNVDEALLEIKSVVFETINPMTSVLSITLNNLPNASDSYDITLKNVNLTLPEYMVAQKPSGEAYASNIISLPEKTCTKPAGVDKLEISLEEIILTQMDFGEKGLQNKKGNLYKESTLGLELVVALSNLSSISGSSILYLGEKNNTPYFTFTSETNLDVELTTTSTKLNTINGRFFPTIDPLKAEATIDLGDDLDFLKEDDIVIDVKNPKITINLQNDCKIKLLATAELVSDAGQSVIFDNVVLTPSDGTDQMQITLKAEQESGDSDNTYYNSALSTFIQPVPDKLNVTLTVKADSSNVYPFELGNTLNVGGDYAFKLPFEFNHLSITYDETSEDIFGNADQDDDDKIADKLSEIKNATISFTTISTFDMDLDIALAATNLQNVEDESLINFESNTIQAGSLSNPVSTNVSMALDVNNVSQVKDLIIRLKASKANCSLSSKQYVILKDIKVTIQNLELDLNDND